MSTPTLAMGGARVDLTFTAGADVDWTAVFVDVLGDPLDITGSSWTAEILDGPGGDLLAAITVVENVSALEFGLEDTVTASLPRRCVWHLVESAAGDRPVLSGSVTVSAAGSGGVTSSQGDTVTVAMTPTTIEVQTIGAGGGGVEDIVHRADLDNPHEVNATDVGLGNVDNTSDVNKPVSTATQTALNGKANTAHNHVVADVTNAGALAALDEVTAPLVDSAAATDGYVLTADGAGGAAWEVVATGASTLGDLTDVGNGTPTNGNAIMGDGDSWESRALVKADVGLSNVDNTSDVNKPVSTATQTALNGKANTAHNHVVADVTNAGALAALNTVGTTQIDDGAVTLAKQANVVQARIFGRQLAGGTGVPEALTAAQAKTVLAIASGDVSGLGALATLSTVTATQLGSDAVTTVKILDANVTLAKLANLAQATFIGRQAGAGTGVPQALTAAQAKTALAIEAAELLSTGEAGGTKFLREDGDGSVSWQTVPSGGNPEGTAVLSTGEAGGVKFLREDGDGTSSWQVPPGSATTLPGLTDVDDATVNTSSGHVLRANGSTWVNAQLSLADISGDGALAALSTVGTTEIDNNAVTLGKLATIATDSFLGRDTAGTGNVEVLSASTARTVLGLVIGTNVQAWSAVLDATTASFTTADETKLDGIEALADVTDAANVGAAGAPIISTGTTPPSSTPTKVGDVYVNTTGDTVWMASGTASSADWEEVTGGGAATLPGLTDVDDATVNTSSGHVLRANGSTWVNAQLAAGDVSGLGALATLSTVTASQLGSDAVTTVKILDANVTLAKMANIATDSFIGRDTAGSGVPEVLSAATAKTILAIAAGDVSGLGALATLSTVTATQLGTDAVTAVKIQADAVTTVKILNANVTLAKMADLAQSTIIGRAAGAGTGVPTALSNTQVKTLLAIASGDVSGLGALATLSTVGTTQIDNNAVTLGKMATMATDSFLGRDTAGTGNVEVLSAATTKSVLALNNVDNTTDANKPVSSAQQTAIDGKVSDTAYAGSWNAVTTIAPSKNAVYDEIELRPNVTLTGTPDYITISGQVITRGLIDLAADITGTLPAGNLGTDAVTTAKILDANVTLAKLENRAQATFIGRQAAAGTGVPQELTATQARTILNVADGATNTPAASETVAGAAEYADLSETNQATGTNRTITPANLGDSRFGTKDMNIAVFGSSTACAVGNGTTGIVVPAALNGMNIVEVVAAVHTAGTTGTMDIQIRRRRGSTDTDVLSTKATIDTTEHTSVTAATAYVVNTANDDLATGDMIFVDVDAIHTTAALGLSVVISARMP
jgi:hypothetical protein